VNDHANFGDSQYRRERGRAQGQSGRSGWPWTSRLSQCSAPTPRLVADAGRSIHWTAANRRPLTDFRKGATASYSVKRRALQTTGRASDIW